MVATCRTLRIGGTPTPGFTMTSDKYTNLGPYTANISISFPTQPGKTVTLVSYNAPNPDTCIKDVILNTSGVGTTTYNVSQTKIIYATLKVGATCCIGFDTCTSSNYVSLTVTPIGNVTFISTPESGAEIWLAPHGQTPIDKLLATPNTISNLPVGTYDYILKKTGYNNASGSVDILEGQTATVTVPMTPAEGCIYFNSTPQTADILIDGSVTTVIDTGFKTPKLICGLSLGSHVYKLTLAGYDSIVDTAILMSGNGLLVTKTLRQTPILTDIIISPTNPSVVIGNTQQFNATPIDQYGNPFPATITWSNSNSFVGNIDPSTGLFTALHVGTSIVTASSGSVNKSTTVTVTQVVPVLTTITVSPSTLSIQAGNATIFTAHTLDQYNNPISVTVTWSSSDTNIGTIAQNGVFTAISPGTTTITASSGNISGIAIVNVTPAPIITPVLTTITVLPNTASVVAGNSTVFTVVTLDQYGNTISTTVTWSSSDTNIGTIDQNGLFTAISIGTTIIRASSGNISGLAIVNVTPSPVLNKIIVSPSTLSISTDNSAIFTATTLDQFGNPFSTTLAWNSSDTNVGTIAQSGVFTAISPGTTTITASSGNISGIAIANVTQLPITLPMLTRIEITPLTTTLTAGTNTVFLASTLDQFGNPISVTVTWTSSDTSIGTIIQNGVFTAISPGTTTITATSGNISGVALANIIPAVPVEIPVLTKITVSPLTTSLAVGIGTIFVASTLDQFNNPISATVTWSSSDTNIGTINQNGVFTAISPGITTITATSGNISGAGVANVTPAIPSTLPLLTRITISPLTTSIIVGNGTIFTASTLDQFGDSIYATVAWSSSDTNVGTIDQNGVFTALSPGITTITASNGNIVGVAMANVMSAIPITQPVLTRITISPLTTTIAVNNSTIFVATTLDQFGNPFSATLAWDSSDTNVGTIDQNGIFTALSPGTTTITAHSGTVNGIAIANVTSAVPTAQPILTKITIEPLTTTILVNNSTVFVASTLDQFGNSTAATVTWSSSDTNVGTIDQNGIFSALNIGKTTITASSGNIIGAALVNVVKTLPGQVTGGILGNINTAAIILGTAIVGAVITYKGSKEKEIERQAEIAKKEIDKAIEIERIREREMKLLSK